MTDVRILPIVLLLKGRPGVHPRTRRRLWINRSV